MSTNINTSLASALFPKSRIAVLRLLLSRSDRAFYLREIAELEGLSVGHLSRELDRLVDSGIITRFTQGRHVYFQANPDCPIFNELRGIVVKTMGIGHLVEQALSRLADRIQVAFIYGSVARGEEQSDSDVDLMVVGEVSLAETVSVIRDVERVIDRPINPSVYSNDEFTSKLASGHHFLTKVIQGEKLMLIGDEHDLTTVSRQ